MTTFLRFFLVAIALTACANQTDFLVLKRAQKGPLELEYFRRGEFFRDSGRFENSRESRRDLSVKGYALKGQFDWAKKELSATVDMTFKLLCSCQESIVLDSRVEEILSITLKNNGQGLGYNLSNGRDLAVDLSQIPEDLRKKEMTVSIRYRVKANQRGDGEPSSLVAVDALAGEPVKSKMVYTYAEPQDASYWMPCVNEPSARALFSVELKMPVEQSMISNGDLIRNDVEGDFRWVKYQTRYTLPTYLMAFAQGDLNVATQYHGKLPVSVVSRVGIPADVHGLLKETIRQISHFESLLVPFPFEKYMVVLCPEFVSGGIEHAGITFVDEGSATTPHLSRDVGLLSHELGHQWFGDLVTVKTWDDLWIKEGMASLLGEEAMRPFEDMKASGRLMGHDQNFEEGDAIIDPKLKPDAKYTSGPYGRAAWLLTQVRATLGEDLFWSTLKKVLKENAFQAIGTTEFLEYFRAAGGDGLYEKLLKAVKAKALPMFQLERSGSVFNLSLEDTEGALIFPVTLSLRSDSGAIENEIVPLKGKVSHLVNDVRLLSLDTVDAHGLESFGNWDKVAEVLSPLMVPRRSEQLSPFLALGAHSHQRGVFQGASWMLNARSFSQIYSRLGSVHSQYKFLKMTCGIAKKATETTEKELWRREISNAFVNPPYMGIPVRGTTPLLSECRDVIRDELFSTVWANLEAQPEMENRSELEFYYASLIPRATTSEAFRLWSRVSSLGETVRSRIIGLQNLLRHLYAEDGYAKPSDSELPQWTSHLVQLLETSRTEKFLSNLLPALGKLKVVNALPGLARILKSDTYMAWHGSYCAAQAIVEGNAPAKATFDQAVGDIKLLPKRVQDLFKDPKACEERN